MTRKHIVISILVIVLLIFGGFYTIRTHSKERTPVSASSIHEELLSGNNKLGDTLTLPEFKAAFNQISDWEIGQTKILKNDGVTTSFVYSFDHDFALSGIIENQYELLYKVILIGLDNEEFDRLAEQIIQVGDPTLTATERSEILHDLEPGRNQAEEVYTVKDAILYKMHVSGNYLYFSAAKDE